MLLGTLGVDNAMLGCKNVVKFYRTSAVEYLLTRFYRLSFRDDPMKPYKLCQRESNGNPNRDSVFSGY